MNSQGFRDQARPLLEDRTGLIGPVEGMGAKGLSSHQTGICSLPRLPLHRSRRDPCSSGKLPQIERLPRMCLKQGKNYTARAAEEGLG